MGTRLFELTYDAPRRLEMMHGDAHPGNFMLMPDDKMGVIDFGAVAPLPGGMPIELGLTAALRAWTRTTTSCCRRWSGSVSSRRASRCRPARSTTCCGNTCEPLEVEVFHYTRKWLQKMTAVNMDRSVAQIKTARQMDIPPKLAIPMRVIASIVAISCQLDAHVPVESHCDRTGSGVRRRGCLASATPGGLAGYAAAGLAAGFLRGRPRGRLRATTVPRSMISPPQTPHGS